MTEGDKGTKFFGQATNQRQVRNSISRVINPNRRVSATIDKLKVQRVEYFQRVYVEMES